MYCTLLSDVLIFWKFREKQNADQLPFCGHDANLGVTYSQENGRAQEWGPKIPESTYTYSHVHDIYGDIRLMVGCTDQLRVCYYHVLHFPPRHREGIEAPDGLPAKDVEVVQATAEEMITLWMECYRPERMNGKRVHVTEMN